MAFRYVEGDFPAGTFAECKAGDWSLVLPKSGLFKAPERVPLKSNVQSVEIVKAQNETDFISQLKRSVGSFGGGTEAANWVAQRANAAPFGGFLLGSIGSAVGTVLGKKEVPVLCVLCDGKFFLANVSMKDYGWLENQSLMTSTARRFRNADFVEAAMALCALMACADGWIDGAKKACAAGFFASDEVLKTFPMPELEQKFAAYCRALMSNAVAGQKVALEAIGKLEGKDDQARSVIRIGVAIGSVNGCFEANGQKIVREVCGLLGIYPGEFGLFYT